MKDTTRLLRQKISSDSLDAKLGQVLLSVAGVLVFAVSFWKLTRLDLTEVQLFFGVLLSLCVPLLLMIAALLLPVAAAPGNPKA